METADDGRQRKVIRKIPVEIIRRFSGMDYFLMIYGDDTYSVPDGSGMMKFVEDILERPQQL